jgi:flagellar biosynthesis protein FlhA
MAMDKRVMLTDIMLKYPDRDGIITQAEATVRRQEIREEADFYGAMDGASKFVRGDAIAGILIVFINLFGGTIIGAAQHGMSIGDAGRTYALLTIGDGLVAQIPALLLSVAVAILVTRVSRPHDMSQQITSQVLSQPRALAVTAGILALLGVIPGMPNLVFLAMAALAGTGAHFLYRKRAALAVAAAIPATPAPRAPADQRELSWDDVEQVDLIGLEVGYRLIPLVDRNQGGELMGRIKAPLSALKVQIWENDIAWAAYREER